MILSEKTYLEVRIAQIIDRDTEEGELAWEELTNHHAVPYVKEGRYPLTQFWMGYSDEPYENLQISKEDYGDSWKNQGLLAKVVADYILSKKPYFKDWNSVLLHVTW